MAEQGPRSNRVQGGRYLLGDLLGEGGFGAVYKAFNRPLNRSQAMKVLLDKHLRDPKFHQRFIREAQTLAALDHPHIVHVDKLADSGRHLHAPRSRWCPRCPSHLRASMDDACFQGALASATRSASIPWPA